MRHGSCLRFSGPRWSRGELNRDYCISRRTNRPLLSCPTAATIRIHSSGCARAHPAAHVTWRSSARLWTRARESRSSRRGSASSMTPREFWVSPTPQPRGHNRVRVSPIREFGWINSGPSMGRTAPSPGIGRASAEAAGTGSGATFFRSASWRLEATRSDLREEETPQPPARSRPGDLWQLGRHRLGRGDATCVGHAACLLGDTRPHLMITHPRFGVNHHPARRNRADASSVLRTGNVLNDHQAIWREA